MDSESILSIPLIVPTVSVIGLVIKFSISVGDEFGKEVMIVILGNSTFGSRLIGIFVREIAPNSMTARYVMEVVIGLLITSFCN